jgi:hypothetical protein
MTPRAATGSVSDDVLARFEAPVESIDDHLIVRLPADASAALPSRGQVAVEGTIDGQRFDAVIEPDGRRGHWIELGRVNPRGDWTSGQDLAIALQPVSAWPEPEVPGDLQTALDAAPDVGDLWSSITPMARWEWVRWVGATRSEATRAKRVDVSISKLRSGKRRPCCFDLSSCTVAELARSGKLMDPDRLD